MDVCFLIGVIAITFRHEKKTRIFLIGMFICGLAAFLIPLASQYYAIQSDAGAYDSLAAILASKDPSPSPAAPVPIISNKPTATPDLIADESPIHQQADNVPVVVVIPTSAPDATVPTEQTASPLITAELTPDLCENPTDVPSPAPTVAPTAAPTPNAGAVVDLDACLEINRDFVAWLRIPGTVISYPVVRSDNSDFYLNHLFDGTKSKLGCLFSLRSSDYAGPSRNIAVYGHHLSASDAMFSTLIKYKQKNYFANHQMIIMDTLYGRRTYRIFSVVNMKVSDWDPATASFKSDAAYLKFINRARDKALIDSGITVTADDYILTLITCDRSYGGVSGRLILMAVMEH